VRPVEKVVGLVGVSSEWLMTVDDDGGGGSGGPRSSFGSVGAH